MRQDAPPVIPTTPPALPHSLLQEVLEPESLQHAHWIASSRRLRWKLSLPTDLSDRVSRERERFDGVAAWRREELQLEAPGRWNHSPWLVPAEVESLLSAHPDLIDVTGLTVLDIGGTAPVSWRFLAHGARALHHIDVSPDSQAVALERCQLHRVADERLVFHTAPAERLPFRDRCFDLVFSRNSVHHLSRPGAYDEIARVLRPGGRMLIFEPWLNRAMRRLVFGRRRALGIDRGTDDPLGRRDIHQLQERFEHVYIGRFGAGATAAVWALARFQTLHPALRLTRRVEEVIGGLAPVSRILATHGWILAVGPAPP